MADLLVAPERPEGPAAPLADRGSRLAAHILDGIFSMVLCVGLALGASIDVEAVAIVFGVLAVATWLLYYPISMQLMGGSTPAKRMLGGMYVAHSDGRPAGFLTGLWRDSIVKLLLSFLIIVDGLFVLLGKERRALHDFAAGTTVRVGPPPSR
jgi:uncharacterized RDD family membrane protein YckC